MSAISVLLLCYCCCQSSLQLEFTQEPLLWRMFCVGNSYYRMQQLQNIHQTDFSLCGVVESFQTVSRSNAVCAQWQWYILPCFFNGLLNKPWNYPRFFVAVGTIHIHNDFKILVYPSLCYQTCITMLSRLCASFSVLVMYCSQLIFQCSQSISVVEHCFTLDKKGRSVKQVANLNLKQLTFPLVASDKCWIQ